MLDVFISQAAKIVTDAVGGKWKSNREVHGKLEVCKRQIRATQIANNLYRELRALRDLFLQHGLSYR